jgi:hypothetical protein
VQLQAVSRETCNSQAFLPVFAYSYGAAFNVNFEARAVSFYIRRGLFERPVDADASEKRGMLGAMTPHPKFRDREILNSVTPP